MRKLLSRVAKNMAAFALTTAMIVTAVVPAAASVTKESTGDVTLYYGDVDKNGKVTAEDALSVLKDVVKLDPITDKLARLLADFDENGTVDAADALGILKVVVKISPSKLYMAPTEAPTEKPTAAPTVAPATPTPKPTVDPNATEKPVPTPNPAFVPKQIPVVEPGTPVEGTPIQAVELNGATQEDGVITFTDANKENAKGVKFENPFAGRTDLRETTNEALAGQQGQNDNFTFLTQQQKTIFDPNATYPRPVWTKGISISFWEKADWSNAPYADTAPLLVIHDSTDIKFADGTINRKAVENFAFMMRVNGTTRFEAGDDPKNSFRGTSRLAGKNHEWNYYTVTFTNDWITVYVNGQENVYYTVELLKDKATKYFNDGWLTRYNTIGTPTQADIDADIRGYISAAGGWYKDSSGQYKGNVEFSIVGNGRYSNPDVVSNKGFGSKLLMDYLTGDNTEIWFGGLETKKLISPAQDLGTADYRIHSGTQISDVRLYDKELTAEEVAANYAVATKPDGTKVTPDTETANTEK